MILCYTTTNKLEEANLIAESLVLEEMIACANIISGMQSIYKWKGEVCREQEYIILMKTRDKNFDKIEARLKDLHSYDCPCLFSVEMKSIEESYLSWLLEETK